MNIYVPQLQPAFLPTVEWSNIETRSSLSYFNNMIFAVCILHQWILNAKFISFFPMILQLYFHYSSLFLFLDRLLSSNTTCHLIFFMLIFLQPESEYFLSFYTSHQY